MVEVITFPRPLSDTGKHRQAGVLFRDVVDQLKHGNRLAHTGTAEETNLAALGKGTDQVNNLDACFQQVPATGLLFKGRRRSVNRHSFAFADRTLFINGVPQHVHDSTQCRLTNRYADRRVGIRDGETPADTFRGTHGNCSYHAVAQLLLNLECDLVVVNFQRVVNLGDFLSGKFDINHRTNYRYDFSATHFSILYL